MKNVLGACTTPANSLKRKQLPNKGYACCQQKNPNIFVVAKARISPQIGQDKAIHLS